MSGDLVGRTVADGRYEILRLIGKGGMGSVYLARQVAMDRLVALKLIRGEMVRSPESATRFGPQEACPARTRRGSHIGSVGSARLRFSSPRAPPLLSRCA